MKTCFLFPGQGAQFPGMAKDLYESSAAVRDVFSVADDVCGLKTPELLFDATEEDLARTDTTQIAMALADVAAAVVCEENGITPDGAAGFSLGEYPALHTAGVLNTRDFFRIVQVRGQLMEQYSRDSDDETGPAGLIAVLGLTREACADAFATLSESGAYLANHSAPTQLVVAGSGAGLSAAEKVFTELGARRVVRLKVSGPFHSPLLGRARVEFEKELQKITFGDPKLPVYANVTGLRITSGEEARDLCARQIVSTVEWVGEEEAVRADGYERIVETGPGSVLSGLWRSFDRSNPCRPAGAVESIRALASA